MSESANSTTGVLVLAVLFVFLVPVIAVCGLVAAVGGGLGRQECSGAAGPGGGGQQVNGQAFTAEQMTNARTITAVVQQRRLPQRAAIIAVSTALVESDLENKAYGDRDSLGLFQQRPSMGWGNVEQITNPVYATGVFLDHLVALDGWYTMPPGAAQQAVQSSAFPHRYAPQEDPAAALVQRFWTGPDNPPPTAPAPGGAEPGAEAVQARTVCPDQSGPSEPGQPQPLPPGFQLPHDPRQRAAVEFALAQRGKPYVYGAKGPDAFDCSGLMQAAWAHAGVPISAGTVSQVHDGRAVAELSQLQPGDLLFIPGAEGSPSTPRHVGMYLGHGMLLSAFDEKTGIVVERLDEWGGQIVAIRRVAEPTQPTGPAVNALAQGVAHG